MINQKYLGQYEEEFGKLCQKFKIDIDKKNYEKLLVLGIDEYFKPLILQL